MNIGIKGGLNFSSIQGDNSSESNSKIGFNLGLLGHVHISKQFALQPEIVYSLQGAESRSGGNDLSLNLNYVNIPMLFQYMFNNGFRLEAGPQLGILASAKSEINNSSTNQKANFKSTDLSLVVGVSYVKPATGFGFDLRYNHGFTNINETAAFNSYNRVVQLGVFYLLGHKS